MADRLGRRGLLTLFAGLLAGCRPADDPAAGGPGGAPPTARPPVSSVATAPVTSTPSVPARSTWPVGSGAGPAPAPSGQPRERSAELGQPFVLRLGEAAIFRGEGLRVEARAVTEDSRCPVNVACVWAGRAVITFVLSRNGQPAETRTLATIHSSEKTDRLTYAGYELHLASVTPRPASPEQPVRREDYQIELRVTR